MNSGKINIIKGFCTESKANPCGMVIFGASGDLTHRKILPAIFNLYQKKLINEKFYLIGCARTEMSNDEFRTKIMRSLNSHIQQGYKEKINDFIKKCFYLSGDYNDNKLYDNLKLSIKKLDKLYFSKGNIIFYMATPPSIYSEITNKLKQAELTNEVDNEKQFKRIIFEKPFGRDLESALELDANLKNILKEHQIYRIDHYLGKETVQNILMFRFANSIFEPIWNQHFIDHVQITVAEEIGIEHRAGYYDNAGQLRDMFQNHIMQLLSLIAIEPPASFNADRVRDETVKLLRSIQPFDLDNKSNPCIIRAQYTEGKINGIEVESYRNEENVNNDSTTETFVAAKIMINNWRWKGVPFYLRSGKRLVKKHSQIAITFKKVPHSMFYPLPQEELSPNALILNVQPDEGISFEIQAKLPGPKVCISTLSLNFLYKDIIGDNQPEPYERLLLDCMLGDQTLFWRHDGIEVSWSLLTPVLEKWKNDPKSCPLTFYKAGTWGPLDSELLLKQDGRSWRML